MLTAEVCHISGDRLAKGIVLRRNGGYMLAALPASCHIQLPELRMQLGENVGLATEDETCSRTALQALFHLSEHAMRWMRSSTKASIISQRSILKAAIMPR